MERPLCQTLSFDDLEVIVLMENGGMTPREVEDSLGMPRREEKGALPLPWSLASTVFRLTPMARSLRREEIFTSTAFAASLVVAAPQTKG